VIDVFVKFYEFLLKYREHIYNYCQRDATPNPNPDPNPTTEQRAATNIQQIDRHMSSVSR